MSQQKKITKSVPVDYTGYSKEQLNTVFRFRLFTESAPGEKTAFAPEDKKYRNTITFAECLFYGGKLGEFGKEALECDVSSDDYDVIYLPALLTVINDVENYLPPIILDYRVLEKFLDLVRYHFKAHANRRVMYSKYVRSVNVSNILSDYDYEFIKSISYDPSLYKKFDENTISLKSPLHIDFYVLCALSKFLDNDKKVCILDIKNKNNFDEEAEINIDDYNKTKKPLNNDEEEELTQQSTNEEVNEYYRPKPYTIINNILDSIITIRQRSFMGYAEPEDMHTILSAKPISDEYIQKVADRKDAYYENYIDSITHYSFEVNSRPENVLNLTEGEENDYKKIIQIDI